MRARRSSRGFTLLEVMMALTVLAIGMLGIVALQAATVGSTQDASQFATANAVTRTWIQRLHRDAQRWNHPSTMFPDRDDLNETVWLQQATAAANTWFRPTASATEAGISAAFDRNGADVPVTDADNSVYCTHLRMRLLYPDLVRAEVRVFWKKRRLVNGPVYVAHALTGGICSTTGKESILGADNENFHWAYAVAGISKVTAQ
jgi:prepilin-type N-terminal cleavage/methylation domain-containing protein